RIERGLAQILERRRDRLAQAGKFLISLSYQSVLQRGFALVRGETGLIGSATAAHSGPVTLEFHDGKRSALITDGAPKPKRGTPPDGTSGQGSLL
ncbi:MAG: exodeoxyribonuclease VII large subunit, partial [Aestuariivirgaceae bacterium]|nr:exodeoxyribonuclease VII large subunit [Aestuariivirgaceae bacterium]